MHTVSRYRKQRHGHCNIVQMALPTTGLCIGRVQMVCYCGFCALYNTCCLVLSSLPKHEVFIVFSTPLQHCHVQAE